MRFFASLMAGNAIVWALIAIGMSTEHPWKMAMLDLGIAIICYTITCGYNTEAAAPAARDSAGKASGGGGQ